MERIAYTVDTLDEAKRLIQLGTVSHLRMALTLLDNAAEILMYRAIQDALAFNEMYVGMHERAKDISDPEARARFLEGLPKPILPTRQKRIEQVFHEKVDFLADPTAMHRTPLLDQRTGRALKAIHRYRNGSYHRDSVSVATLRPAVLLLFEIACELFEEVKPVAIGFIGGRSEAAVAEQKRLEARFGGDLMEVFLKPVEARANIANDLRAELPLSVEDLRATLAEHVMARVENLREVLRQIPTHFVNNEDDEATTLKRIQFWNEKRDRDPFRNEPTFQAYRAPVTVETLDGWVSETEKWGSLTDKLTLFGRFADVEEAMELIENLVNEVADELDRQTQMKLDAIRGK